MEVGIDIVVDMRRDTDVDKVMEYNYRDIDTDIDGYKYTEL